MLAINYVLQSAFSADHSLETLANSLPHNTLIIKL